MKIIYQAKAPDNRDYSDINKEQYQKAEKNGFDVRIVYALEEGEKPFGYFRELLDHKGESKEIWLGCDDERATRQSHIPGQTGDEIVALYRLEPMPAPKPSWRTPEVEKLAKEIYAKYIGAHEHPWVEGGCSLRQEDARFEALKQIEAEQPADEVCHRIVCDDRCSYPSCMGPAVSPTSNDLIGIL